jgi:hypothetical protein
MHFVAFGTISNELCLDACAALLTKRVFYPQELDHLLSTLGSKTFIDVASTPMTDPKLRWYLAHVHMRFLDDVQVAFAAGTSY